MTASLLPEKPLLISPSLAATIGLEEALLLSVMAEAESSGRLLQRQISERLPFWPAEDIQRIAKNLQEKGLIQLTSAPYTQCGELAWRFSPGVLPGAETAQPQAPVAPRPAAPAQSNQISPGWQPDAELKMQLAQYNIPDYFIRQQVPEFVTYWRERGEAHHSWGAKFLKQVVRRWREHEAGQFKREQDTPMTPEWRPSQDAMVLLVRHAGINQAFVEDAIAEFVLYWRERGDVGRTWNTRFIQHVKRQWAKYTNALEHDTEPKRLPDNWQPGKDVFDVLALANIDLAFARRQIPEFVLFWRESNRVHSSWNTKFLQHVKYHWARQHSFSQVPQQGNTNVRNQSATGTSTTRDRSLVEDLTDRSWAG
ncbi:DnaT-like ssDNA-binding domain-containing protein [Gilvimarinus xylanilyticus]|uniref:DnaT-like ssDNA-binding domain-containing protein n=1 Tax=Gilvimarinus xylanilyticus TaxID=2944139 RepID=A0A9X2I172_9GAMM|nr:DnaT-like ssDNA-binding domain-containing protein [Gilvimarinus xylanilyticus]MCP8900759.1 DnaT-like ssDNA-binding domain-containing protein [Gilvimarinus xylanilyticus]